jgi:hypothetical protein
LTLKFDQAASDLSDHKQDIEFLKKELENEEIQNKS